MGQKSLTLNAINKLVEELLPASEVDGWIEGVPNLRRALVLRGNVRRTAEYLAQDIDLIKREMQQRQQVRTLKDDEQ
jgi:hypothetical protein